MTLRLTPEDEKVREQLAADEGVSCQSRHP